MKALTFRLQDFIIHPDLCLVAHAAGGLTYQYSVVDPVEVYPQAVVVCAFHRVQDSCSQFVIPIGHKFFIRFGKSLLVASTSLVETSQSLSAFGLPQVLSLAQLCPGSGIQRWVVSFLEFLSEPMKGVPQVRPVSQEVVGRQVPQNSTELLEVKCTVSIDLGEDSRITSAAS